MIDYRLKTFVAVAEQSNFTKAGEILGLTQPAVTQHIKYLEEYFSTVLFEKKGRGVVLTQAGEYLKKEANKLSMKSTKIRRVLNGFDQGRKLFTIGATLTIGEYILPSLLGLYKKSNKNNSLEIKIGNTSNILKDIKQDEIDLALVEGDFDHSFFNHELLIKDELIFITSPNSPWSKKEISLLNLHDIPLILREEGSGTRDCFQKFLSTCGAQLTHENIAMEVGSLSLIKSLCESGMGCSVISRRAVLKELKLGVLIEVPILEGPISRNLEFVYKKTSAINFINDFILFSKDNLKFMF